LTKVVLKREKNMSIQKIAIMVLLLASSSAQAESTIANPSDSPVDSFESGGIFELSLGWQNGPTKISGSSDYSFAAQRVAGSYYNQRLALQANPAWQQINQAWDRTYMHLADIPGIKNGFNGINGGFHFGYDGKLPKWNFVIGLIMGGSLDGGKAEAACPYLNRQVNSNNYAVTDTYGIQYVSVKHNGEFDAAIRLGYAIQHALPFIKLGWAIHNFVMTVPGYKGKTKWPSAFMFGLGLEYGVSRNTMIGVCSEVHFIQNAHFKAPNQMCPGSSVSIKPKLFNALFTVKYKYPETRAQ
jgi:opacity protein-like surface antigen